MKTASVALFALFALFCFAPNAFAEPMSVYGSDESEAPAAGGLALRGGAGSLFGPAFDAGQPEYAHSDGFGSQNRRPFSAAHQIATTFGLAASLTAAFGAWTVGPTALAGFHATSASTNAFSGIELRDQLQGLTLGGGLRATHGAGAIRLTIDAVASHTGLRGAVDWKYSDFFADDTLIGSGEWEHSLIHLTLLGGVEIEMRPLFLFLNAGAQFLPRQTREYRVVGTFPEAHTRDPFNTAVVAQVKNVKTSITTFDNELSIAASAGIGLRF